MIFWGTFVNAMAIVLGGLIGIFLPGIRESYRATVMQGIGLAVFVLGTSMALESENFLIVVTSLVMGGLMGEWLRLEELLNRTGERLHQKLGKNEKGDLARGFVTTTLIFCVGSMAILGALDSGLRNDHDILYIKAALDGFTSVIFASTFGIGVLFSAVSVLAYQGSIVMVSRFIYEWLDPSALDAIIREVTAVGGVLIIGIGLNILQILHIRVANLLPALLFAAVFSKVAAYF